MDRIFVFVLIVALVFLTSRSFSSYFFSAEKSDNPIILLVRSEVEADVLLLVRNSQFYSALGKVEILTCPCAVLHSPVTCAQNGVIS